MALYFNSDEVAEVLTMEACIQVMEEVFRQQAQGLVENRARQSIQTKGGWLRSMMGALYGMKTFGMKTYFGAGPGFRHLVLLHDLETAELTAIVEARGLMNIRTGATSAVATKYLARTEAQTVGIIGVGKQAPAQLEAMCLVRPIRRIKAYSRTKERLQAFADAMSSRLQLPVEAAASAEECVRGSDVVITATNARTPVLKGEWLEPGTHVNAIGATVLSRQEIDEACVTRAGVVVVEELEQAKQSCAALAFTVEGGGLRWNRVQELHQVIAGAVPGRLGPEAITLFSSIGVASEDIAAAAYVLQHGRERGLGQQLPL